MAEEKENKKKTRKSSALKRDLQNEKHYLRNKAFRSEVKTAILAYNAALSKGESAECQKELSALFSLLDKGAKMGIFKKNKTDRLKSRAVAKKNK